VTRQAPQLGGDGKWTKTVGRWLPTKAGERASERKGRAVVWGSQTLLFK